jgi:hypothetical protein
VQGERQLHEAPHAHGVRPCHAAGQALQLAERLRLRALVQALHVALQLAVPVVERQRHVALAQHEQPQQRVRQLGSSRLCDALLGAQLTTQQRLLQAPD